jgi:hypothetical protein
MKSKKIYKSDGRLVKFSSQKVRRSLIRSGAPRDLANKITQQVEADIKTGMKTNDIYRLAFKLLKKEKKSGVAARYNLKQAILELGPTGFPFERFISRLFEKKGFATKVSQIYKGQCVNHEVDVVVDSAHKTRLIECKFRNYPGSRVNVKIPLYIQSRFLDIKKGIRKTTKEYEPWIITNSTFSTDAITYAECIGMKIIGWRYPRNFGLEHLIEDMHLHPITCLSSLTKTQKQQLLRHDIVICKELFEKRKFLQGIGVNVGRLYKELETLCAE